MTLIDKISFNPEDESSSLVLIPLTVTTDGTAEVPQIILLLLELIQAGREQI